MVTASMPNRLTAVPASPPHLSHGSRRLVPAADVFMWLMLSRPEGQTLATTWVTPATLLLAAAASGVALLAATVLLLHAGSWSALLVVSGCIACVAFAAGGASLLVVGVAQRRNR